MASNGDEEMLCAVCLNYCGDDSGNSFNIFAWNEFKTSAVVPCGVRAHFNSLTKNSMRFMANGRVYAVKLHKEAHKTSIFGAKWAKFFSGNHLGGGEMVSFDMSMPMPEAYIAFQISNGSEDETSPFKNEEDDESSDDDDVEEDAPKKDEADILYTRGSHLNESEQLELEGLTPFNDEHRGIPFVHHLTKTNIETGMMKIPKLVAKSLHIPKQGAVGICLHDGPMIVVAYSTCNDGHIAFNTKDWSLFASGSNLKVDKVVLISFKTSTEHQVDIVVAVDKLF